VPSTAVREYDWATSKISFPKDRNDPSGDIWTTSQDNGFMVISLYSAVTVSPTSAALIYSQIENFSATVTGAAATGGATWSVMEGASGGSINSEGVYTAPTTAGTYHVVATALLDPTKTATAAVTVGAGSNGCSSAGGGVGGFAGALGVVGLLLVWRRRRSKR